ncbi:glycosyltransferase [Geotoga petraea]|nr:glycosyltransferase [Geotoga petraea]
MKVGFLNPQGNFDNEDSYLTEHPDFGGQLIYVKELAKSLSKLGVQVDIITRQIKDKEWPEFEDKLAYYEGFENVRIVRIPFGGDKFLNKENLWYHIDEFTDNIIKFYDKEGLPDYFTTHYADGGYSGYLLKMKTGIPFTFTGHSLGAQKMDKMKIDTDNFLKYDKTYHFSKRIAAERISMKYSTKIITSTDQERKEQYSHSLYSGAIDANKLDKFEIIPPGVNIDIFNDKDKIKDSTKRYIDDIVGDNTKPFIILSSRLDAKKNHIAMIKAYAGNEELQKRANLGFFLRNIKDPYNLEKIPEKEREILKPIIKIIKEKNLEDKIFFFDFRSQKELADAYRYFSGLNSVFSLTAFYEPFGLAPIEAAACGLAIVATKNGGPAEIFNEETGVLVDPENERDIAKGCLNALDNIEILKLNVKKLVYDKYTWDKTAEKYYEVLKSMKDVDKEIKEEKLDAKKVIIEYLSKK